MKEQHIDTIEELEKEIDNLIVLYYYENYIEMRDLNCNCILPENRIDFMLIMRLKSIKRNILSLRNGVTYSTLTGDDAVILVQYGAQDLRYYEHHVYYYRQHVLSTPKTYIRKPTSEEIKSYKNLLRYRKIFGKNPNPSQLNINENK